MPVPAVFRLKQPSAPVLFCFAGKFSRKKRENHASTVNGATARFLEVLSGLTEVGPRPAAKSVLACSDGKRWVIGLDEAFEPWPRTRDILARSVPAWRNWQTR